MEGLKKKRKQKKLTQVELAEKIGVSTRTISQYEENNRFPRKETLKKLADFFECTIDELISDDNSKQE